MKVTTVRRRLPPRGLPGGGTRSTPNRCDRGSLLSTPTNDGLGGVGVGTQTPGGSATRVRGFLSPRKVKDRRYGTQQWRKTAKAVLRRDMGICRVVKGCSEPGTAADHIIPVAPGMPNGLFFGMSNLRASCRTHNLARGFAAQLDAPADSTPPTTVIRKDYSR
jgi:5-methylcytosine-specific restriction endonuclease McrA